MKIETIEAWNDLRRELRDGGYSFFQSQYAWDQPEGCITRFWAPGGHEMLIVTHSKAVSDAILQYDKNR